MHLDIQTEVVDPEATYPIVGVLNRGRGLLRREAIAGSQTKYATLNRVRPGQVVYSRLKAFEGAITVATDLLSHNYASQEFPTFTCGPDLLPRYFRLVTTLESFWDDLRAKSKGMGGRRERVKPGDFLDLLVAVPPLDVQRRIVDLIGALDMQIEMLRKEAAALTLVSHATLDDCVSQALEAGPLMRLDDLLAAPATYGVLKPGAEDANGVPLIRGQDIQGGSVAVAQVRTITRRLDAEYRRSRVTANDLVLVLVGVPGSSGLVPAALEGANISRAVGRLRCAGRLVPEYLLMVLSSPWGRSLLAAEVRGAVQQMINLKELRALQVPVPNVEVQMRLASEGLEARYLGHHVEAEVKALKEMRGSLLGSLLSGVVTIPESYDALLEAV